MSLPDPADRAFDALFLDLQRPEPSELLERRTLAAWQAERRQSARRTRILAGVGMVAVAAMVLLSVRNEPTVGQREQLVERGPAGEVAFATLKVAVKTPTGEIARFAANRRYAAGHTLMFRVSLIQSANVSLSREGSVLWNGSLDAGEHDLPVGYQLEAGELAARFVVQAGPDTITVYLPAVDQP